MSSVFFFKFQLHTCKIKRNYVAFCLEKHEWLLSDEISLLSHLLLPLAGPEEFEDNETEKLPLDLQYLPVEKMREHDIDVRKLLVESVILVKNYLFLLSFELQRIGPVA